MINIQDELQKIHHQYGTSEKANYKIQLLFEEYSENYFQTRTTLDKNVLSKNEQFFSIISKIDNFLKIEPILISNKDAFNKKEIKLKFNHKRNANIYCKHFNSAFDNGKSLEECEKIALDEIKRIFG